MPPPDATPNPAIESLQARLVKFRDDRDWGQFHSLKNLIQSLNIEAGELLELVQWHRDSEADALTADGDFSNRLGEEIADVFIYLLLICEKADIDILRAAHRKIDINEEKYPIAKAFGRARKYDEL